MELAHINSTRLLESDAHLGAYLSGMDVDEALESFNRLADQLSASDPLDHLQPNSPTSSHCSTNSSAGSQWLSSCNSGSVSPIDLPCSPQPSCYSSGGSSSSFSSRSSRRGSSKSSSRKSSDCAEPLDTRRRREKNATAAERYRRKLKGQKCNLEVEEDAERRLNEQLKRQVEFKLELYREFVVLLARNTRNDDQHLARLGLNSVLGVVSEVCRPSAAWLDSKRRLEFELQAEAFSNILAANDAPPVASSSSTPTNSLSDAAAAATNMEFDFYSDTFVPAAY